MVDNLIENKIFTRAVELMC